MFTGLVEDVGRIVAVDATADGGQRLTVVSAFEPESVEVGDSIAVQGVCLTAVERSPQPRGGVLFRVDVGPETRNRTTLGRLSVGDGVNLERSLLPTRRLGGHWVQGHVDAVGVLRSRTERENGWDLWIDAPAEVLRLVIPRGSVAVDGVSLTVNDRDDRGFVVCIIPHTWVVTTLGRRELADAVNLEADLLARYVDALLPSGAGDSLADGPASE
ncbi:MAG TPA: riboflavin synthase [Myxococcales bacterium LLY-WYZ-16_1]|nr:riboflavin synthase [Myxococcales bacterium LLY-WYZ-16_1]